ncbi:hypothetical protein WJX73_005256 [Symbiochloris irregularis]|uniref:Uncharacterized protein n=1 Tax=Symbiochloris irregularis TaxID=706552 RepID=A0AAW1NSV5_9CHLO
MLRSLSQRPMRHLAAFQKAREAFETLSALDKKVDVLDNKLTVLDTNLSRKLDEVRAGVHRLEDFAGAVVEDGGRLLSGPKQEPLKGLTLHSAADVKRCCSQPPSTADKPGAQP